MANGVRSIEKEQFWRFHVEAQAAGGREIRAYCREWDLSEPAFYAWRRELKRRDAGLPLPKRLSMRRGRKDCATLCGDSASLLTGQTQSVGDGVGFVALDVIPVPTSTLPSFPARTPQDARSSAVPGMLEIEESGGLGIRLREEVSDDVLRRVLAAMRREVRSC